MSKQLVLRSLLHAKRLPHSLYLKIAEPRVRRLIYFVIYLGLILAGAGSIGRPTAAIENILGGMFLIWSFGGLIIVGGTIALFAVLPGIWWLERSGIISIVTGVAMYAITLLFLGASFMVTVLPVILILICALRWLDIKEYLLAPREG